MTEEQPISELSEIEQQMLQHDEHCWARLDYYGTIPYANVVFVNWQRLKFGPELP